MALLLNSWDKEFIFITGKKKKKRERGLQKACILNAVLAFSSRLPGKSHLLWSDEADFQKHGKNHLPTPAVLHSPGSHMNTRF